MGSSLAQHILLVASSFRSPRAGAAVQLPAPGYWGPLTGPFPSSLQNGSYWGALPGPGSGSGRRWGSATQVDPPVLHLHVSTALHGDSQDQGAWKAGVPQEPKKVSSSSNLGTGTFSPGQCWRSGCQTLGPMWQTGWGQQVVLCCLQSPGTAEALSDLQITVGPPAPVSNRTQHTAVAQSTSK